MSNRTLGIIAAIGAVIVAMLIVAVVRLDSVRVPSGPAAQKQQ
jgi:hypothetical protein